MIEVGKLLTTPERFVTVEATQTQIEVLVKASAGLTFSFGKSPNGLFHLIQGQWILSLSKREVGGEKEQEM